MISRYINLLKLLENNASAFLLGPRGTGKSKLSKLFLQNKEIAGSKVLTIDLLSLRQQQRYSENPSIFRTDIEYQLTDTKTPLVVLIDEVQKLPMLLDEVHYFLEEYPRGSIQFLLTGSSARKLKGGGANLLAGRALSLALHPLSLLELKINLERALQFGTLPRFYLEQEQTELLIESYVETYLKEEIQSERVVRRLEPFQRFLSVAAQMNGKLINYSEIARQTKISDQTVRDYYSILVDTHLVFELPAWNRSVRKQIAQSSRFYFFDCGVLNGILGEQSLLVQPGTNKYGMLFENYIITEFFRQNDYLKSRKKFYSWRTSQNEEVDLVIDFGLNNPPIAVEIKSSVHVNQDDLRHLNIFKLEHPEAKLFCIARVASPYTEGNVTILPWETGITEILSST